MAITITTVPIIEYQQLLVSVAGWERWELSSFSVYSSSYSVAESEEEVAPVNPHLTTFHPQFRLITPLLGHPCSRNMSHQNPPPIPVLPRALLSYYGNPPRSLNAPHLATTGATTPQRSTYSDAPRYPANRTQILPHLEGRRVKLLGKTRIPQVGKRPRRDRLGMSPYRVP